ncbi:SRPBCC family protein, partial [Actinocorallia lasiicapitis]
MELDHEIIVPADPAALWQTLQESATDRTGKLKLKVGTSSVTLNGTLTVAVVDDFTRTLILEAEAKEARGPGTLTATFQATVHPTPTPSTSRLTLHSKLSLTARLAPVPTPPPPTP